MKKQTKLEEIKLVNEFNEQTNDMVTDESVADISTAKMVTKAILQRMEQLQTETKTLTPEARDIVYNEMLGEYGLNLEQLRTAMGNLNPSLPPSAIFSTLGWLPISEMLQRVSLRYDFTELIPYKIIENGLHRIFYRDFRKVDNRSAYDQKDYQFDPIHNPLGAIVVEEIWKVYMNIHAGFTMWDQSLNQNTKSVELFIAMFNEIEWNIGEPIAVELYRLRMKLIAEDLDFNGVLDTDEATPRGTDWSTLTPDITIQGADDYEALEKLFAWMIGLNQSSRKNLPTRWTPTGLAQNLMTRFNMDDYMLIAPVEFIQHLNVSMKSGRFNDKYLKMITEFVAIDYDKSFGEFNGDTNYKTTFNEADLRLVPRPSGQKGVWLISQFDAMRSQPNLNLTSVAHEWMFVGHAFHRLSPVFRIKFKSGGSQPSGSLKTINGENLTGTGDIKLQVPITTRATDLVFDSTETNRLQLAGGRITEIEGKADQTTLDGMFKVNTATSKLDMTYNGDVNLNSKHITNIADGVSAQDVVSKKQLDAK